MLQPHHHYFKHTGASTLVPDHVFMSREAIRKTCPIPVAQPVLERHYYLLRPRPHWSRYQVIGLTNDADSMW